MPADLRITIAAPRSAEDSVVGVLSMAGLDAVEVAEDEDEVRVSVYWPIESGPPPSLDLTRVPGAVRLADVPVERTWAAGWPPVQVGPLWIASVMHEDAPPPPAGTRPLWLEAGVGFGFGDHPSTRLALAALLARPRPLGRVLDVGCGTGVLGLAAGRIGAKAVWAFDTDPGARAATRANARRNQLSVRVLDTPPAPTRSFDLVLANITPVVLRHLADDLRRWGAPGGILILSGLPDGDAEALAPAYAPMVVVDRHREAGWTALTLACR